MAHFLPFGFVHALFYRIMIFVSVIYGIVLLASLLFPLGYIVKPLTVIVWILLIPQVLVTAKVPPLVSTHGAVFGRFSREYTQLLHEKRGPADLVYAAFPYAALAVWIALFAVMLIWWP